MHVPSSGTVRFDGRPIDAGNVAATVRSGIAYVPQGHNVFPNLSVEQNLNISGLLFDATFSRQVYELFPMLNARRAQTAGSMSGGEQQMLALGMALMTRPKWLLLDEPFTGLAPIIIEAVMKRLREINERYGTGLLIVEQNVPITLKAVDRAIILKSGRRWCLKVPRASSRRRRISGNGFERARSDRAAGPLRRGVSRTVHMGCDDLHRAT